jgi:hypothetical protein
MRRRALAALLLIGWALPGTGLADDSEAEAEAEHGDDDDSADAPPGLAPPASPASPRAARVQVLVEEQRAPLHVPADTPPSRHELSAADLRRVAGALSDPLRAMQTVPGAVGDLHDRAAFGLRGAGLDEISLEIDGIPVRRPAHAAGLVSLFDPDLLERVEIETGTPGILRIPSLSGGIHAEYKDGPARGERLGGALRLDLLAASGHLALGLDRRGRHAIVLGARRSLLPLYLRAAGALGAFAGPVPRGGYGEGFGRWTARLDEHTSMRTTVLLHDDRLLLDDVNERQRGLGLGWELARAADRVSAWLRASHGSSAGDEPDPEGFEYPHARRWLDAEHRTALLAAVRRELDPRHALLVGAEIATTTRVVDGQFPDTRDLPFWAPLPLADFARPLRDLHTVRTWPDVAAFVEADIKELLGPLSMRVGLRGQLLGRSGDPVLLPRASFSLPIPQGPTFAAALSLHAKDRLDALALDRDLGAEKPAPERALHAAIGMRIPLRFGLQLGVEGWVRRYLNLLVFPDGPRALELRDGAGWSSGGTGTATGIEASARLRAGRVSSQAAVTALRSRRENPLATRFVGTLPTAWEQALVIHYSIDFLLGRRKGSLLSLRYDHRSGLPRSTVLPVRDADGAAWSWEPQALGDRRSEGIHRVAGRFEHSWIRGGLRWTGAVELAGLPAGAGMVEDCPSLAIPDDEGAEPDPLAVPDCRDLLFLPRIVPWLGISARW